MDVEGFGRCFKHLELKIEAAHLEQLLWLFDPGFLLESFTYLVP